MIVTHFSLEEPFPFPFSGETFFLDGGVRENLHSVSLPIIMLVVFFKSGGWMGA